MVKEIKVKPSTIFYFVSILVLTKPDYIGSISSINRVYNILLPIILLLIFLLAIKNKIFDKIIFYIILFYISIFIPTIIYAGDLYSVFMSFIIVFSYYLLISLGIRKDGLEFLKIISFIYFLYNIVNFLTIVLFPNGLFMLEAVEKSWLLGHKNGIIKWILPGFLFISVTDMLASNKFKISSWIYLVIMVISIFMSKSTTSIISILILLLLLFFVLKKDANLNFIKIKSSVVLNIIFFIAIVILRMQNKFIYIINYFGKTIGFTGRDKLWDRILIYIREKPFFGNGFSNINIMRYRLKYTNVSSHNLMLDYLYEGGIVCLLLFINILYTFEKKIKLLESRKIQRLIYIIFFCFSIIWLTETFLNKNMLNIFAIIAFGSNLYFVKAQK